MTLDKFKALQGNLQWKGEEKDFGQIDYYMHTKLANNYFTQYLAETFEKKYPYIKNACLHPGGIITDIFNNFPLCLRLLIKLLYPVIWYISKTARCGAQTTLYLCYEDFEKIHNGQYYDDCKRKEYREICKNLEMSNEFIKWSYMVLDKSIDKKFELPS